MRRASATHAVLITGASTGIGRATALHLDGLGMRVYAGVRRKADADSLTEAASDRLVPVILDVTDECTVAAAADQLRSDLAETGLHGLVNNAGITAVGPWEFLPLDELREVLEVNVVGQLAVTQALLPALRAAAGRIVFTSSISGRFAAPFLGPYATSKFALEAFAESLRREIASAGVRVSVIEPGNIATPIWGKALDSDPRTRFGPAAETLYGPGLEFATSMAERGARTARPAKKVARAIEHALTAQRPRRRYLVGVDARLSVPIATHAPALLDWAIAQATNRHRIEPSADAVPAH